MLTFTERVLIVYPSLRDKPTAFPPYGCLYISQAIKEVGGITKILNLDTDRHLTNENILEIIRDFSPTIIGISAVTSTTYKFLKDFIHLLKSNLSNNFITMVGGNITCTPDLLIEKCHLDICFIGEAYFSVQDFIQLLHKKQGSFRERVDFQELQKITGLSYHDGHSLVFTGHRKEASLNSIKLVENFEEVDTNFYFPLIDVMGFSHYPIKMQEKIKALPPGKRQVEVLIGSGCQNACTFCHRNVKGIRNRTIEEAIQYLDRLIEKYNLGIINFADESFFFNKEWLNKFTEAMEQRNILFIFGGVRAKEVLQNEAILVRLVKAGLIEINVGLETGSELILKVMHKNTTAAENLKAVEIINRLGIYHCPQIILGMPGDAPKEIKETKNLILSAKSAGKLASINVAQVLPGTPMYWFALYNNLILNEEEYLIKISGRDAMDYRGTVEISEYPIEMFEFARRKIFVLIDKRYKFYKSCLHGYLKLYISYFNEIFKADNMPAISKLAILIYIMTNKAFKVRKLEYPEYSLRKFMIEKDNIKLKSDPFYALKCGL